ncbi:MAG: serpin family protein, partial [Deferrisomatales bacterium]
GPALLAEALAGLSPEDTRVSLPRFALQSSTSLAGAPGLGPATARFQADFAGIDGTRDLFVAGSGHHTAVTVDEGGLRVAHQTLVTLDDAVPETWTSPTAPGYAAFDASGYFVMDSIRYKPVRCTTQLQPGRPWLFVVRHADTGVLLVTGRVVNPDPGAPVTPAAEFEGAAVCPEGAPAR